MDDNPGKTVQSDSLDVLTRTQSDDDLVMLDMDPQLSQNSPIIGQTKKPPMDGLASSEGCDTDSLPDIPPLKKIIEKPDEKVDMWLDATEKRNDRLISAAVERKVWYTRYKVKNQNKRKRELSRQRSAIKSPPQHHRSKDMTYGSNKLQTDDIVSLLADAKARLSMAISASTAAMVSYIYILVINSLQKNNIN